MAFAKVQRSATQEFLQSADHAIDSFYEGARSVLETVQAIRVNAEKISIIKGITNQTDMLASGATIEAANRVCGENSRKNPAIFRR